jgi:hypothetical protein
VAEAGLFVAVLVLPLLIGAAVRYLHKRLSRRRRGDRVSVGLAWFLAGRARPESFLVYAD